MTHQTMIARFDRQRIDAMHRHVTSTYNHERATAAKDERRFSRFDLQLIQEGNLRDELRRNREQEVLAALDAGRED